MGGRRLLVLWLLATAGCAHSRGGLTPLPERGPATAAASAPGAAASTDPQDATRAAAAAALPGNPMRAIAVAEERRARPELTPFLASPEPVVRARAALALGRLQDSLAVAALTPLATDSIPEVRREAVFALGQIGHRSAREALGRALATGDLETTDLAIEALGKLGDTAATPLVTRYLADTSPRLRGEAAMALWRLADSTAIGALIARHSDPDPGVRWRVLYALEKVPAPDRVVLIAALHLDDPEWLTRAYAVRTLGRQKSTRATAYVLQKLDDREVPVVVNAIRALQSIADSSCGLCGGALTRLLSHPHPYVRVTAATALADRFALAMADSSVRRAALDTLAARLGDTDAATRGASARALLAWRGIEAWPQVRSLLADSSVYARVALLQGIGAMADSLLRARPDRFADALAGALAPGLPLFQRMTAAEVLGALIGRTRLAPFTAQLPTLRAGIADSSLLYVASCASALGDARDTVSVVPLARAFVLRAGDAEPDARLSIRDALRALAGRTFADSLERARPAREARAAELPGDFAEAPAARGAVLHTSAGEIEWAFDGDVAPQTVKNFIRLAERGYFDGLSIHRVVPHFVIQDGDPTGTGSGGPGYTIRCEYNRLRYEEPGMVGMALSGKDTGGSQWFITHSPQPHLNGRYTIFAHVIRGQDVVGRIVQGERVTRVEILR